MMDAQNEMDNFAKTAAKNIQNSFADFLFDPFAKGTKGMLQGFIDAIRRMVAEALAVPRRYPIMLKGTRQAMR